MKTLERFSNVYVEHVIAGWEKDIYGQILQYLFINWE